MSSEKKEHTLLPLSLADAIVAALTEAIDADNGWHDVEVGTRNMALDCGYVDMDKVAARVAALTASA